MRGYCSFQGDTGQLIFKGHSPHFLIHNTKIRCVYHRIVAQKTYLLSNQMDFDSSLFIARKWNIRHQRRGIPYNERGMVGIVVVRAMEGVKGK